MAARGLCVAVCPLLLRKAANRANKTSLKGQKGKGGGKGKSGGKGKGGDKSGSSAWHQSTNGGQKRQQFNKNFAKNWKRQRY